ncbi:MAG TPA: hypothetical protein VGK22_01925 [Candidatus Angelobacter sp.]|jgi:hypothetical protein
MSGNSGKWLEELVRSMEEYLLPDGFKVESRERIFNDAGEQIAEFDLVISGRFGSTGVSWLIECRDRPSEGAASGGWIEQLVGRKIRFKFDEVFAVSTTGFSPSATDCAEKCGIVLRTVQSPNEIKADFRIVGLLLDMPGIEFIGPINGELEDPQRQISVDVRRPVLRRAGEATFLPMPVFVSRNRRVPPSSDLGIEMLYFQCEGWVETLIGDEIVRVRNFRAPLLIKHVRIQCRALFGRVYSEGHITICAESTFEVDSPQGKIKTRMQVFKHLDGRMSARLFNEALPDGYYMDSIAVFGWNDQQA